MSLRIRSIKQLINNRHNINFKFWNLKYQDLKKN